MDPRKKISEGFLSDAPGCSGHIDQCILDGHYYKSLMMAKRCLDGNVTQEDLAFISAALKSYADTLIERNFWNLAHLSKKRSLNEIDPMIANAVYQICLNVDELKLILYADSSNINT